MSVSPADVVHFIYCPYLMFLHRLLYSVVSIINIMVGCIRCDFYLYHTTTVSVLAWASLYFKLLIFKIRQPLHLHFFRVCTIKPAQLKDVGRGGDGLLTTRHLVVAK
jgi:hypothetical protein